MDDGVGFSVSTRFIYAPERRSNGSWGLIVSGSKKREIGDVISDSSIASDRTRKWTAVFDWLHQISLNAARDGVDTAV